MDHVQSTVLGHIAMKTGSMMFFDDEGVIGDPGLLSSGGRSVNGHGGHFID